MRPMFFSPLSMICQSTQNQTSDYLLSDLPESQLPRRCKTTSTRSVIIVMQMYLEKELQVEFHSQKCTDIYVIRKQRSIEHKYLFHGQTLEAVQSGKYLGVTLHNKLNWTEHMLVCNIQAKSSKTLGFLRRNLQGCRPDIKATVNSIMVRSTLEYAATVWDPYQHTTYSH